MVGLGWWQVRSRTGSHWQLPHHQNPHCQLYRILPVIEIFNFDAFGWTPRLTQIGLIEDESVAAGFAATAATLRSTGKNSYVKEPAKEPDPFAEHRQKRDHTLTFDIYVF